MASQANTGSAKILSIFKPTIALEEVSIKDVENTDADASVPNDGAKPSKIIGNIAPFIKVNGFVFDHNDISDLVIKEVGFLPTINVTLRDIRGVFKSAYFPKNRPVLSLYIRSKHDKLKCIRCDFLITDVSTESSPDHENRLHGKNMELIFSGVLFIPELYSNLPKSYANMTSYEVLQQLATSMQLGFATNENYTNDKMTWLKPLIGKSNFIQHVLVRSFKDDDSFYMGFIDKYYHLNFINMSKMFDETGDMDQVYEKIIMYDDLYEKQSDAANSDETSDLVLTNYSKAANTDTYIYEFRPETTQGNKLIKSGYVRSISYYDQQLTKTPKDNLITLDVSPRSNTLKPGRRNPNDKGTATDDNLDVLASNLSYGEWCGIDYNNGHDNFNYAQIQNEHNNQEIRKNTLYVKLKGINLNLIRGMRVPVLILMENIGNIISQDGLVRDEDQPKQDTERDDSVQIVKDKWLSGYYVVGDLTYTYDVLDGFITEATLLRMNWNNTEAKIPIT